LPGRRHKRHTGRRTIVAMREHPATPAEVTAD
jgi:hypothetical protein